MTMHLSVLNFSHREGSYLGKALADHFKKYQAANETLTQATVETAKHYCFTAVLHGVKYLAEPGRSHFERFVWSLLLLTLVATSLYLLWITSLIDLSSQLLISLGSSNHPIWEYPFPAVTICPNTKINRTLAEEWVRDVVLSPEIDKTDLLEMLPNILHLVDFIDSSDLETLQLVLDKNNISADELYLNISIQCQDLLVQCRVFGEILPCENFFKTIRTTEGYCCSFNYFGVSSEFLLARYYKPSHLTQKSPQHVASSGKNSGLSVLIRATGESYGTLLSSQGAKLLLHEPTNYPDHLVVQRLIRPEHSEHFSINPILIFAGHELREISPEQRNCFFYNELSIPGVQQYSYKNCIFNCRTKFFKELCDCVPFYYPTHEETVRTCNLKDVSCLSQHEYELHTLRLNISEDISLEEPVPCGCRPQCNEITYEVATYSYRLANDIPFSTFENVSSFENYSEVNVFFKALFGTKYERIAHSSPYQVLANFGGLLGLSFGFSFISVFEILYTFTIRIFFRMYLNKKEAEEKM